MTTLEETFKNLYQKMIDEVDNKGVEKVMSDTIEPMDKLSENVYNTALNLNDMNVVHN